MAILQELKTQVESANVKGKEHLKTLHCIELDEKATTHDIMDSIAQIPPLQYAKSLSNFMRLASIPENTEYTLYLPKCENLEEFMFNVKNIKNIRFTAVTSTGRTFLSKCFYSCSNLEQVWFDLELEEGFEHAYIICGSFSGFCSNCRKLKSVKAVFDVWDVEEEHISIIGCPELEEIFFADYSINRSIGFRDSPKLSLKSAKSILLGLESFVGTNDAFTKTVTLHNDVWEMLAADGNTAPGDITWADYITEIGWNK